MFLQTLYLCALPYSVNHKIFLTEAFGADLEITDHVGIRLETGTFRGRDYSD